MSEITLYMNKSDDRVLNKTFAKVAYYKDIKIMENTNVLEPTVLLRRDIIGGSYRDFLKCNYAYLSSTTRYYFIKNYEMKSGGIIAIHLKCDVLQSYANEISNLSGLVLRNEFENTPYYVDNELPFLSGRNIERHDINNNFFSNNSFGSETPCISLTVTGGN